MDISVGADVRCADGDCGRCTYAIVNPTTRKLTHLVVRERSFPHTEYLVPLDLVAGTTPDLIRLRCTQADLVQLDPFIEIEFVPGNFADFEYGAEEYMLWPYAMPEAMEIPVEYERVPSGELAVRRGAKVRATDGYVGRVDEFLVDPASEHITHLIMREGHLWGQKDVTIPIAEIDRIEEDTVHLKLNRQEVEGLPSIPVRR